MIAAFANVLIRNIFSNLKNDKVWQKFFQPRKPIVLEHGISPLKVSNVHYLIFNFSIPGLRK